MWRALLLCMTLGLTGCQDEGGQPPKDGAPPDAGAGGDGPAADSLAPDLQIPDRAAADRAAADRAAADRAVADGRVADGRVADQATPDRGVPDRAPTGDGAGAGCAALTKAVTDAMAQIAKCSATSECTFLWGTCPFGCHVPHNKSASLSRYNAAIAAYRASSLCRKCTYKCGPPGTLSCKAGACVMTYP